MPVGTVLDPATTRAIAQGAVDPVTGLTALEGRGLAVAIRKALRDAAITPQQVGLIASFAAGLVEHDRSEAAGLRAVLGDRASRVPVLNIKAGLGNNGAGSGAIDFIAAVLALHH